MQNVWLSSFITLFICVGSLLFAASEHEYMISKQTHLYYPNSNRIAVTYTWDGDKIAMREAFAYSPIGVIAIVTADDGCDQDINSLKGVTFRKVTHMIPNNAYPFGMPFRIEEYVVDLATGGNILVKTVQHYFSKDKLIRQEIFDANNESQSTYEWEYDPSGKMSRQVNVLGGEIIWGYDAKGNRTFEKGPKQGMHKEITFDAANRVVREDEVHGDLKLSTHYRYDTAGRMVSEVDPYGNEKNYVYDVLGNLTQVIDPFIEDENGKFIRPITMYVYNQDGQRVQKIDPKGNVTKYVYSDGKQANPNRIVFPDGSEQLLERNKVGDICKETGGGITKVLTRDFKGRVIKTEHFSSDGQLLGSTSTRYSTFFKLSETDARGVVTEFEYDALGRKIKEKCGKQHTFFEYDGIGRVKKQTRSVEGEDASTSIFAYDAMGNVIEEREEDRLGNVLKHKKIAYNVEGLPVKIITFGADGEAITQIKYDSFGMKTTIDAFGNTTIEKRHYDYKNANGQLVPCKETIDPTGVRTIVVQDALKRDREFIKRDAAGNLLRKEVHGYDILGNLSHTKEITYPSNGSVKEYESSYQFDYMHRCLSRTDGVNTDSPRTTVYSYDEVGRVTTIEKPSGIKLVYEYSPDGLLTALYSSDDSVNYTFTYDKMFRLSYIKERSQKKHIFSYDASDHIIEEILPNGLSIGYTYDITGRQIAKKLPDSSKVQYKYADGFLRAVERISPSGALLYTHTFDKYSYGLPIAETLLDRAGKLTKSYDKEGKLKFLEANSYRESIPSGGWDPLRRIVKQVIKDGKGTKEYQFVYNSIGKVLSENGHSYTYLGFGDLSTKDAVPYLYNKNKELTQVGLKKLQYDKNGNLIFDGDSHYTYDALDRLISVKKGKHEVVYTYDAFNRRLTKSLKSFKGSQVSSYLYDGKDELACYSGDKANEVRILGLNNLVAIELNDNAYVPICGLSGSVSALFDHIGGLVESCQYSAFGEEIVIDAKGKGKQPINPWRYSQARFDKETAFYYIDDRYYNPYLGIFISKKPISVLPYPQTQAGS